MNGQQEKRELKAFYNELFGTDFRTYIQLRNDMKTKNIALQGIANPTEFQTYRAIQGLRTEYERQERSRLFQERERERSARIRQQSKQAYLQGLIPRLQAFDNTPDHRVLIRADDMEIRGITNREILDLIINNVSFDRGVFMNLTDNTGQTFYPLNFRNINLIKRMMGLNSLKVEEFEILDPKTNKYRVFKSNDSDEETLKIKIETMNRADILLTNVKPKHNKSDNGKYFKYKNKCSKLDLKRYGIINEEDYIDDNMELYKHNCLYLSLQNGGMSKEKLTIYKTIAVGSAIPISKLNMICEKLDIYIKLKKVQKTKHNETTTHYGDNECEEQYSIALIDEHYFINEPVEYNSYAIKNYFTVCEMERWNELRSESKREKRFIDSYDLVKLLIENKDTHLQAIKNDELDITNTPYEAIEGFSDEGLKFAVETNNNRPYEQEEEQTDDEVIKEVKDDLKRVKIEWKNAFLDFETRNDKNNVIRPFMGVMEYEGSNIPITTYNNADDMESDKCVWDILEAIKPDTKIIIQNAKFDFSFMIDKLNGVRLIENAGRIITASGIYKKKRIMIIDFINFTGMPLRDCASSFKLDICKEYIPYRLYDDYDTIKTHYINTNEVIKRYGITGDELETFKNNITRWGLSKGDEYNPLCYCYEYCKLDVRVLKQSYIKFRDMLKEELHINIDACEANNYRNILTISSLAKQYSHNKNYFNGCVSNNEVLREFIQKSIVGGRTMISENTKKMIYESNAVDANSLYPSAIHRLGGFLKGKPKHITKDTDLSKADGYNVYIRILSHTVNRKMPLFSVMEKGKRNFTNDMDGKTIYCGKIALEDLIKYHGVKYEIIHGIYWDEGRTDIDINSLYQTRLRYKKEGDVKETIYKLILNSIYGFTIMKEHREGIEIKDNQESMMKFISKNYNWIISSEQIKTSDKWLVKKLEPTSEHLNFNHIGCEVLDMSKRIMNEVVCNLEDVGYEVSYTDTDSCFMSNEAIEYMRSNMTSIFGGVELGQFKLDFGDDISITKGYLLGKKSYYVKFNKADKKGKTEKYRMKGIPASTIKFYAKQNKISVEDIFIKLYNGETIPFDLCEVVDNVPTKFKVDNMTNRQLERKTMFIRNVKF
jgi:hypothetical protein